MFPFHACRQQQAEQGEPTVWPRPPSRTRAALRLQKIDADLLLPSQDEVEARAPPARRELRPTLKQDVTARVSLTHRCELHGVYLEPAVDDALAAHEAHEVHRQRVRGAVRANRRRDGEGALASDAGPVHARRRRLV